MTTVRRLSDFVKRTTLSRPDRLWICFVYAFVVGMLLLGHDMWRDEAQLWLVSKASSTPWGVLSHTAYETRPLSWFYICWIVSRFTSNFEAIKIVNWLFAVAMAWCVVYLLPLRREIQILFLSGFVVLLGYAVVSEDYMLGTLLLVLCTAAIMNKWSFRVTCLLLAGLANVHFLFFMIAVSALGTLTLARMWSHHQRKNPWTWEDARDCAWAWILSAFSLALTIPQKDFPYRPKFFVSATKIPQGINSVVTAVFPWIDKTPQQYLVVEYGTLANSISTLVVLLVIAFAWYRHPLLGLHATVSSGVLIGYFTFGNYFYWWHVGVLGLNLITILMIGVVIEAQPGRSLRSVQLGSTALLVFVLAMQAYSSTDIPGKDLWGDRPYSNAKHAASFVRNLCGESCTVVFDQEIYGTPVVAYLDRPIFYVDRGRFGTYSRWDDPTRLYYDWPSVITAARQFPNSIIITSGVWRQAPAGVTLLAEFGGAVWSEEDYQVWKLS